MKLKSNLKNKRIYSSTEFLFKYQKQLKYTETTKIFKFLITQGCQKND